MVVRSWINLAGYRFTSLSLDLVGFPDAQLLVVAVAIEASAGSLSQAPNVTNPARLRSGNLLLFPAAQPLIH